MNKKSVMRSPSRAGEKTKIQNIKKVPPYTVPLTHLVRSFALLGAVMGVLASMFGCMFLLWYCCLVSILWGAPVVYRVGRGASLRHRAKDRGLF